MVVLACRVFRDLVERYFPGTAARQVIFLEYGLHSQPRALAKAVQQQIDSLEAPSLVVLGYGLCGNGLHGIQARQHHLLIARADDCIAILLGSHQQYVRQFEANPGTYYLTKGWLESGSNPLQEYQRYLAKYGEAKANWLMDSMYHNYKRLVFVAHNPADLEQYRPQALEVARYCERFGMRYEEILGAPDYFMRLAQTARGEAALDADFIWVEPGGELRQKMFLRGLA